MLLTTKVITYVNRFRYGGKPYGEKHACELRRRLGQAWEKSLDDAPGADRFLSLPAIFLTLKEVTCSLMDARVTLGQLEPEISDFHEIIHRLNYESREGVRAGDLSWSDFSVGNEIRFGVCLLEWHSFYTILMFNEREAFEWVERQRRAKRARA